MIIVGISHSVQLEALAMLFLAGCQREGLQKQVVSDGGRWLKAPERYDRAAVSYQGRMHHDTRETYKEP